jgi:hypothetical protein
MTVGLRQTKKFLAGHKLLMTLRARDIFKISHSLFLYRIGVMEYWILNPLNTRFNPFNRVARFNRYAPFNPPPLSSPATRGRMKEGV